MNDSSNPNPHEQLHARVTAWLLGELPPSEAAAMAERVRRDRELALLADQLRRAIGLLRAASANPSTLSTTDAAATQVGEPLQLANERREKLLAHFKTLPLPQPKVAVADTAARENRIVGRVIFYTAAAACVLLLASLMLPTLSKAKAKAQRVTQASLDKQRELEERLAEADRDAGATASRRMAAIALPSTATPDDFNQLAKVGRTGGSALPAVRYITVAGSGIFNRSEPAPASGAPAFSGQAGKPVVTPPPSQAYRYDNSGDCSSCSGPPEPSRPPATPAPARPQIITAPTQRRAIPLGDSDARNAQTTLFVTNQLPLPKIRTPATPTGTTAGQSDKYFVQQAGTADIKLNVTEPLSASQLPTLGQRFKLVGGNADTITVQTTDAYATVNGKAPVTTDFETKRETPPSERRGNEAMLGAEHAQIPAPDKKSISEGKALQDGRSVGLDSIRLAGRTSEADSLQRGSAAAEPSAPPRPPAANAPVPQPEVSTADNAFSTFSLNVSDVSFQLAAASLAQGRMPDAATVRAEEFLNAFDLRDPEPAPGAPLAFTSERARHPFAHNRDLLRLSLKTAALGRAAGQRMNLVLVLDNSGSMERADRVRIVHEAMRALGGLLNADDRVSVIGFARTAHLWMDGASGNLAGGIPALIRDRAPQGGTNLEEALRLGYATALRHFIAGGINHVVLLTDGAANLGDVNPASLQRAVATHRQMGIALDCLGVGWEGFNDDLLEVLARNGDGRYGFLNSPEEAETEFAERLAGALHVAAADVKVQVEFNPRRVTSWRQLGYAKHQLTKEQFRDNTVDAAELAAKEAGNALYTVELKPAGEGPVAIVRARFRVPDAGDFREHSWEVPFAGTAPALDQSGPAMRLAAAAALFAEWLAASPFAGGVTPDALAAQLRGVPELFGADPRPRQLEEMLRQAGRAAGR